ncbi:hypothetical protein [Sulfurovum sp.]|uniref:hypothetical protein n=1 Tax=Sulfurovum sp. TaxID=1969726 RepID=UPI003569859A
MKIVLDCNIYDILAQDSECLTLLTSLIEKEDWKVLIPITLLDELKDSPFKGIPDWIQAEEHLDLVAVYGHTKYGEGCYGDGNIYECHKGNSIKIKDAIIVDFAVNKADIFVSEDRRARKRLLEMDVETQVYDYNDFKNLTRHWRPIKKPPAGF